MPKNQRNSNLDYFEGVLIYFPLWYDLEANSENQFHNRIMVQNLIEVCFKQSPFFTSRHLSEQSLFLQGLRKLKELFFLLLILSNIIPQYNILNTLRILQMSCSLPGKRYSKYTREMRIQLIRLVDQQRLSTAHAARVLGIKQTSACRIMKSYHQNNKIFERKLDRINRQQKEPKTQPTNHMTFGLSFGEENIVNNYQNSNNADFRAQRAPFASISRNLPENMEEGHRNNQELSFRGGLLPEQMPMPNSSYFSVYYPGMYPLLFNCFM